MISVRVCVFFFLAEDGIRDYKVTGVQTCALPISPGEFFPRASHPRPGGLRAAARSQAEPRPIGQTEPARWRLAEWRRRRAWFPYSVFTDCSLAITVSVHCASEAAKPNWVQHQAPFGSRIQFCGMPTESRSDSTKLYAGSTGKVKPLSLTNGATKPRS